MIFNITSAVLTFGEQGYSRVGKALWILHLPGLTEGDEGTVLMRNKKSKPNFPQEGRENR